MPYRVARQLRENTVDRANEQAVRKTSNTPKTDEVRFLITVRDVGTEAVRPGHMAEMEEQRKVLLIAAKLALLRAQRGKYELDGLTQFALEAAVKMAEL